MYLVVFSLLIYNIQPIIVLFSFVFQRVQASSHVIFHILDSSPCFLMFRVRLNALPRNTEQAVSCTYCLIAGGRCQFCSSAEDARFDHPIMKAVSA